MYTYALAGGRKPLCRDEVPAAIPSYLFRDISWIRNWPRSAGVADPDPVGSTYVWALGVGSTFLNKFNKQTAV